jgi:putative OPT family oligopeptide transporter
MPGPPSTETAAAKASGDAALDGFQPYIPASKSVPELTPSALVLGALLGIIFGASSLYLFLKVGMTVSASIPVAVLAITIFRWGSKAFGLRQATILENNIVQTTGSAGESIAFGVGATMPALLIMGYNMEPMRVLMVSVLGGVLGILMMIPLRRAFVVKQHGALKYPEGTACAKILEAGERGGASAKTVFAGFGLAFLYQVLMEAFGLWTKEPSKAITGVKGYDKAVLTGEVSPALLGVGYIIGPRIAATMVGGGFLTSLVLIPAIAFFGQGATEPIPPVTSATINEMAPGDIGRTYVRYIGAGAVAAAGIISMLRALPLILSSITGSLGALRGGVGDTGEATGIKRTERDLPLSFVAIGALALVAVIALSDMIPTNTAGRIAGAAMIVVFGFLFVTVSSRLTGEIGSSSNPISGMTIATLLLTCLIFYLLTWVGAEYRITALSIAAVVCIASSNGGTTSQDLKTGFLVGATPSKQQWAIIVGAITSALVIGFVLSWLNTVYTDVTAEAKYLPTATAPVASLTDTYTHQDKSYKVWWVTQAQPGAEPGKYLVDPETGKGAFRVDPGIGGVVTTRVDGTPATKFNPPQPALFATIIDGIMTGKLPWGLILLGAGLAIVLQLTGASALAFAVGVYLPLSTTFPIFIGGLVRLVVDKLKKTSEADSDSSPAVLMSSGLIAGGSMAGILMAALAVMPLAKDYFSTDALPASRADVATLADSKPGPDQAEYKVWSYAPSGPESEGEPGTYLVDATGQAKYRVVTGTFLDLSKQLGFPRDWHERPIPAIAAFFVLVAALLWTGLRARPAVVDSLEYADTSTHTQSITRRSQST